MKCIDDIVLKYLKIIDLNNVIFRVLLPPPIFSENRSFGEASIWTENRRNDIESI